MEGDSQITAGATRKQKKAIVEEFTATMVKHLGKNPEHIHIVIQEIKAENRGFSGMLTDDYRKQTSDRHLRLAIEPLFTRAFARYSSPVPQPFARIVPELTLDKTFDYAIPEPLQGRLRPGHRVRVPFGNRKILGYVVELLEHAEVENCRSLESLVEETPLISSALLSLARWMIDYYCSDLPSVLKVMLPEPVRSRPEGHLERLWVSLPPGLNRQEVAGHLRRAKTQWRAWQAVEESHGGWLADLIKQTGIGPAAWKALADRGFVRLGRQTKERTPFAGSVPASQPLTLNPEQAAALKIILKSLTEPSSQPILLQGVTGSGKTEIYLQALAACLAQGGNALILVPEISLTPQTIARFRERFEAAGVEVAVLHSQLSGGERHDQWHRIRNGQARIVIGARSAVFAPLVNLRLIIVDEEHEPSYKQEESPFYHGRDTAVLRAKLEKACIVLGSATPSLESIHNVRTGKYLHARLTKRIDGARLPIIHIVDLRRSRKKNPGTFWLTRPVCEAIEDRAKRGEQSLLYLNRRGFATSVQCPNCGHVEYCPHCSVPLTFHKLKNVLRCHLCDHVQPMATHCPACEFEVRDYFGAGTQRIEDVLAAALPGLRWKRVDSDSMKGRDILEETLRDFANGKLDVLIGTQMIAKGLHIPSVTCVGIVSVDSALNLPDFRAAERVFQQIVQVAGRAGRGGLSGEVFIQTHTPFHPAISFGRHHDVDGFLDHELTYRREYNYPPYTRAVLITFRGVSDTKTAWCAQQAAKKLKECAPPNTDVGEVAPAPIAMLKDFHRFQILLRTSNVRELVPFLRQEVTAITWPEGVRATVNVDPINLM
jgi:primosomal protein N' (replication factor Y)